MGTKRLAIALLAALAALAATRPRYGGTLRVEIRETPQSPEVFGVPKGFVPRRGRPPHDQSAYAVTVAYGN